MPKRGLFLQGGGVLGAWQAAVLDVLERAGWRFEAVMGYSIGAVNGTALALGRLHQALDFWRSLSLSQTLRLRPRLFPFSLFAPVALERFLPETKDDEAARGALLNELAIVSACPKEERAVNARFTPGGREGWDAPLLAHLASSCAIPFVYPPVRIGGRVLIDGGVPMERPFDMTPLSDCSEVLVLEMVRPEEIGRRFWPPWRVHDQLAREAGFNLTCGGVAELQALPRPPRVTRLMPSRVLEPIMLDFRASGIAKLMRLGQSDARGFLSGPSAALPQRR